MDEPTPLEAPTRPPPQAGRGRRIWPRIGLLLLLAAAAWTGVDRMSPAPELGPQGGRLRPCPDSPNCVCSQDADSAHTIAPLPCPGPASATEELVRLQGLLAQIPRLRTVEARPGYLRLEATTALWRFRDDLEFLADDARGVIHVRSASRLGHSDLGTNRRRVERIRGLFLSPERGGPLLTPGDGRTGRPSGAARG